MSSKIKNLIFILVGLSLILVYVLFFKKDKTEDNLTVNNTNQINTADISTVENNPIDDKLSNEILATLSSIKSITLEDKIFKSNAFNSLIDGTVPLVQDGNQGRPNPFAPIGNDASSSVNTTIQTENTNTTDTITTTTNTNTNTSTGASTNPNANTSQNKKPN